MRAAFLCTRARQQCDMSWRAKSMKHTTRSSFNWHIVSQLIVRISVGVSREVPGAVEGQGFVMAKSRAFITNCCMTGAVQLLASSCDHQS